VVFNGRFFCGKECEMQETNPPVASSEGRTPLPGNTHFEPLEPRRLMSTVQVFAAGNAGGEQIQLQLNGAVVATYTVTGANADAGVFQTFTYEAAGTVIADDVRVSFINDFYDEANDVDLNARIDAIAIDGVRYETEDVSTFSTATYTNADGNIVPGFGRGDTLHSNGYFQYDGPDTPPPPPPPGSSTVRVFAAGVFGTERIELRIDGAAVAAWSNLGTGADAGVFVTRTFEAAQTLSADQVRVAFTNDLYDPANDIDWNVRVDAVEIDGVRYESESSETLSTGTWTAADGDIVPGFGRGDFLHANGYFEYAGSSPPANRPPNAVNDVLEASRDGNAVALRPLANDSDPDGDPLTLQSVGTPAQGTAVIRGDRILYTPRAGFTGADVFSYTVADGRGGIATARVDVTVVPAPQPGILQFVDTTYRVDETAGSVAVGLERVGGTDGEVSATYVSVADTATAGSDFTARSGRVTFSAGQSTATILIPILDDGLVEGDEAFSLSLSGADGGASLGVPRTRQVVIADDEAASTGNGLLGEYFRRRDFTDPLLRRTDATVDFSWGNAAPSPLVPADLFTVRWSGQVVPPTTGTWAFRTLSDDGVRLTVDGRLIIDNFTDHGPTSDIGTLTLNGGQPVDITMEYYENRGGATARLFWSSASQAEQVIPTAVLFSEAPVPVIPPPQLAAAALVSSGLNRPTAVEFAPDGTAYILTQPGEVKVYRNGTLQSQSLLDLRDRVNFIQDRGSISLALHPDFASSPYLYVAYTYDPPQAANGTGLAGRDGAGNRAARVSRWTLDAATNHTTVVAGSEKIMLGTNSVWANINQPGVDSTNNTTIAESGLDANGDPIRDFVPTDSRSHTIAGMAFGTDGSLYVSTGDASSFGSVDLRAARVQNLDNLAGKVLRINPETGAGYSDNPYFDGDAGSNRSKVFAFGLRNPFRIAVNPVDGQVYVGDVGWTKWEEINRVDGAGGNNFGWPFYEGGYGGGSGGVNLQTNRYNTTPEAQAFYAGNPDVTAPLYARDHGDGARAISLGTFYTGTRYPGFENALFFSDFIEGSLQAAFLAPDGTLDRVVQVSAPIGTISSMTVGPDGFMYYTDLFGGKFGRINPVA